MDYQFSTIIRISPYNKRECIFISYSPLPCWNGHHTSNPIVKIWNVLREFHHNRLIEVIHSIDGFGDKIVTGEWKLYDEWIQENGYNGEEQTENGNKKNRYHFIDNWSYRTIYIVQRSEYMQWPYNLETQKLKEKFESIPKMTDSTDDCIGMPRSLPSDQIWDKSSHHVRQIRFFDAKERQRRVACIVKLMNW